MIVVNNQGPSSFPASGGNTVLMVVYVNTPWVEVCAATTSDSWISVTLSTHYTARMDTYCYYLVTVSPNTGAYRVGSVVFRSEGSSLAVTMLKQGSDLYVEKSIGDPVFYDVTGRTDFEYGVVCDGVQVLDALAKRAPDATAITLDISSIARDYLKQDMVDIRNVTATMVHNNDALRTVSVTDEYGADIERWKFLYEYLGEWTGQTPYNMSEPINGHISPVMKTFHTIYCSGDTPINYEIEDNHTIKVSPTSIEFGYLDDYDYINISSDTQWTASTSAEWLQLSQTTGSGNSVITVSADTNTGMDRASVVRVSTTDDYADVNITQERDYIWVWITESGTIGWRARTYNGEVYTSKPIYYRKNLEEEWTLIGGTTADTIINVSEGDILNFYGEQTAYADDTGFSHFTGTAHFNVGGELLGLIASGATFGEKAFYGMFANLNVESAQSLVLPDYTTPDCYNRMFQGCTLLTDSPNLRAETLADNCYYRMFRNCSSLGQIVCLALTIGSGSTTDWVYGVASSGTFWKNPSMTSWSRGVSAVPNNWSIVDWEW